MWSEESGESNKGFERNIIISNKYFQISSVEKNLRALARPND